MDHIKLKDLIKEEFGGYLIKAGDNDVKDLYWSEDSGWVNRPYADVFSEKEKRKIKLPIGGGMG